MAGRFASGLTDPTIAGPTGRLVERDLDGPIVEFLKPGRRPRRRSAPAGGAKDLAHAIDCVKKPYAGN